MLVSYFFLAAIVGCVFATPCEVFKYNTAASQSKCQDNLIGTDNGNVQPNMKGKSCFVDKEFGVMVVNCGATCQDSYMGCGSWGCGYYPAKSWPPANQGTAYLTAKC